MNFDLSEDELMLRDVAARFVSERYTGDARRRHLRHAAGFCPDNWALLGELGLVAAPFAPDNGGLGASATDLAVIFEALGRGLVVEPLAECAVLAGGLFESIAPAALQAEWLPGLVTGERRLAVAHRERSARDNPAWVETRATPAGEGWRLDGQKSLVPAGVGVDAYLVSARRAGGPADGAGASLFLVPADAPGLVVSPLRLVDGSAACQVTLDGVAVPAAARLTDGLSALTAAESRVAVARLAEAVGVMDMLFNATLDYLRQRRQFGVAIGSFQAIQHRMVRQYAQLEQARSLMYLAVMADPADAAAFSRTLAGARAYISEASVELGHEAIQLHGGMGVSDELIIGHAHKRLLLLSRFPTAPSTDLATYAAIA